MRDLTNLLGQAGDLVKAAFRSMEWVEDEIRLARVSAGCGELVDRDDPLWRAFMLCCPSPAISETAMNETIVRGHARELLARVTAGEDTRPGTDAEICCASSRASLRFPLSGAASLVYMRAMRRRFPGLADAAINGEDLDAYERLHGQEADELTVQARHMLAQPGRVLPQDGIAADINIDVEIEDHQLTLFGAAAG